MQTAWSRVFLFPEIDSPSLFYVTANIYKLFHLLINAFIKYKLNL